MLCNFLKEIGMVLVFVKAATTIKEGKRWENETAHLQQHVHTYALANLSLYFIEISANLRLFSVVCVD